MRSMEYSDVDVEDEDGIIIRPNTTRRTARPVRWVALGVIFVAIVAIWSRGHRKSDNLRSSSNNSNDNLNADQASPMPTLAPVSAPVSSTPAPIPPSPTSTPPTTLPLSQMPIANVAPTPPETSAFCDAEFKCITDRVGQYTKLVAGLALCNEETRFGLTQNGTLIWHNCTADETFTVETSSIDANKDRSDTFFFVDDKATIFIGEGPSILWSKPSNRAIELHPHCLHKPLLDCPYFHLHPDGVLVLNWIDTQTGWEAHNAKNCYDDFFLK